MALIDRNFRYQAVNDAYMKAYGRSRDQIIGHPVHELMGEELFDSLLHSRFNRCLEGIASSYEAWLEFPRRGRRFMSVTYYPYFDTSGAVAGIMLSFRDVTDLKRAEEGLRRSEAKYRAMFAASPDYIYITDTEAKFLDANPAFLRWAGLSPEELQQRYFRHFFAGDHVDKLQAYIEKIKAGEVIHKLGMRVKNTRGEIAECEINGVPLEENGGITAILNMARDVTEQVRADSTLRESEEKYRALFEASTDAILLETVDGRVLDCNARACDMYGYSHEELTRLSVVDLVPEGIAEELPGLIAEGLAAGSVIVRAAGKRKDGSLFPTEVGTRLISLRGRQLVVAYVRDLTGQVPAQEVPRRLTILPQP
jgi:PAS domain S-box-containing protein